MDESGMDFDVVVVGGGAMVGRCGAGQPWQRRPAPGSPLCARGAGYRKPFQGVKAGWHGVGPVTDPDARTFEPEPVQLEALRRYAREWLPGVDAESAVPISCTYTSMANEDFVVDRFGPLVIGAGFSGHRFKFTPAIGRVLADLVDGIDAPRRFSARSRA